MMRRATPLGHESCVGFQMSLRFQEDTEQSSCPHASTLSFLCWSKHRDNDFMLTCLSNSCSWDDSSLASCISETSSKGER